jgi:acetate kinase
MRATFWGKGQRAASPGTAYNTFTADSILDRAHLGSRLAIHVVRTDEEPMIARHTVALLAARKH